MYASCVGRPREVASPMKRTGAPLCVTVSQCCHVCSRKVFHDRIQTAVGPMLCRVPLTVTGCPGWYSDWASMEHASRSSFVAITLMTHAFRRTVSHRETHDVRRPGCRAVALGTGMSRCCLGERVRTVHPSTRAAAGFQQRRLPSRTPWTFLRLLSGLRVDTR